MKKLLSTLLIIGLLISVLPGCATVAKNATPEIYSNFTYEGDYNPYVFMEWEVLSVENFTDGVNNYTQLILDNPANNPVIRIMVAVVVQDAQGGWSLISYGYNKYGIDYVYILDIEQNHYGLWMSKPSTGNIHKL